MIHEKYKDQGVVYLIHFAHPLHHASHYLGFSESWKNFHKRMLTHYYGKHNSSSLMRAVAKKGIPWGISKVYLGANRDFERYLKTHKKTRKFCPVCLFREKNMKALYENEFTLFNPDIVTEKNIWEFVMSVEVSDLGLIKKRT